ncbi:hypothetical protein GCM10008119_34670 [Pedobacter mendelii]|uniref:Uncharacterized protein n=1 Tax=Pedobacter mendelii TaxID=1908240 RepID=A0ABQ2BL94_9SPHI|nr:hypothetical protein GCM10008119_34670 [Pedobacter mendelii]
MSTNKTKSLLKDCQGVNGMASPKQPQLVTTLKKAETKVNKVKKMINNNNPHETFLPQKPNKSIAPKTISSVQSKIAIPVEKGPKKSI